MGNLSGKPEVQMHAEPLATPNSVIYAFWRGKLDDGAGVRIRLWAGPLEPIANFFIDDGQITTERFRIGFYTPGGVHTFLVRYDPRDSFLHGYFRWWGDENAELSGSGDCASSG